MAPAAKMTIGVAMLAIATYVVLPLITSGAPPPTAALLIGGAALVLTVLLCAAIPESRVLLREPCLLVPPSCALGLQRLSEAAHLALFDTPTAASLWWIAEPGVAATAVYWLQLGGSLLIWSLHAAWLTPMIVRVVRGDRARDVLLPTLRRAPALLGRSFGMLALGCLPTVVVVLAPVAVAMVLPSSATPLVVLTLFVLLVVTPLWNQLSATLLLRALDPERRNWLGVGPAMVDSWRQRHAWMAVLFAQLVLLGFVAIVPAGLKVHGMWVGGYDASNHWFADAGGDGSSVLGALLTIASLVLAIAIKLRIARCIESDAAAVFSYRAADAAHR